MEIAKNHERFLLWKCAYISQNIENNSHSMLSKIKNETWKRSHNFSKTYIIGNIAEKKKKKERILHKRAGERWWWWLSYPFFVFFFFSSR